MRLKFKRRPKRRPVRTWYGRRLAVEHVEARVLLSANTEPPVTTVNDEDIASIRNTEFVDVAKILFADSLLQDGELRLSPTSGFEPIRIVAEANVQVLNSGVNVIFAGDADNVHHQDVIPLDGQIFSRNANPAYFIQPITPSDLNSTTVIKLPDPTTSEATPTSREPTEDSSSILFNNAPRSATEEPSIELVDITKTLFEATAVEPLIPTAEPVVTTHDAYFAEFETGRRTNPVARFFATSDVAAASSREWQLDSQGSRGRAHAFEIAGDTRAEAKQSEFLPNQASPELQRSTQTIHGASNESLSLADSSATHDAHQTLMFLPLRANHGSDVETGAATQDNLERPLLPKSLEDRPSSKRAVGGVYRTLTVVGGLVFAQGWRASEKRIAQDDIGLSYHWRLRK